MKTGRYLKYALGEILLVVIGILIALSINNWNEKRKLKKTEWQTILALKAELTANIKSLEDILKFNQPSLDTARMFINGTLNFNDENDQLKIIRTVSGFAPLKLNHPILSQELGNDKKIIFRNEVTHRLRELDNKLQETQYNTTYLDQFWNGEFTAFMVKGGHMTSFTSGYINNTTPTPEFLGLYHSADFKNIISAKSMLLQAVIWSQEATLAQARELFEYLNTLEE